ncbi:MAG: hypothetical protein EPO21_14410 [Chloroflexota bacterium]|nr:MAG: hypothetical protein EPO21_14410 [Chloroflexota bacterium]
MRSIALTTTAVVVTVLLILLSTAPDRQITRADLLLPRAAIPSLDARIEIVFPIPGPVRAAGRPAACTQSAGLRDPSGLPA